MPSFGPSQDVRAPKAGPAFAKLASWPYRVEMAVATATLAIVLLYWRLLVVRDLDVLATIFWFLWPDLAAFVPIGVVAARGGGWPSWGSALYNSVHTFLTWAPVFLLWSVVTGVVAWPLLGWAGHITMDRAAGYYLRARPG